MTTADPRSRLPGHLADRLRLPVIAAPMLRVSGVDLVTACCNAGVIGSFPTANARSIDELRAWIGAIKAGLAPDAAPWAANLIVRNTRMREDLDVLLAEGVEMVITSVGSPAPIMPALREAGVVTFADIATLHHARKAVEAGVDGLVLLVAGAGGQTGWANPFAFVRAVRDFFDGPLVLAGGLTDGHALKAAQVLGADLGYMGTRFIAARESMADPGYKRMLAECSLDDIQTTRTFTGLIANFMRPSILQAGLTLDDLDESATPETANARFGGGAQERPKRWKDIWSAGHSVTAVREETSVAAIVDELAADYAKA